MGYLYKADAFFKTWYNNKKILMTHGVTMKVMIGIPPCVTQDELNSKKPHIETRGTVKSEVPGGDPKCPNIIEASVYDTKPVHYTSMVSE